MSQSSNKLSAWQIVVGYSDLASPLDYSRNIERRVITISALKEFDEAMKEAHLFAQEVLSRPCGKVHGIYVFVHAGPDKALACPVPQAHQPSDETIKRFVVAWEDNQSDGEFGAPLKFFEVGMFCLGVNQARAAAVNFAAQISANPRLTFLYMAGHTGNKWHPLNAAGRLTPLLLTFKEIA